MSATRTTTRAALVAGLIGICLSGCGGGSKRPAAAAPTVPTVSTTSSTPVRKPHKPAHPAPKAPPHRAPAKQSPSHQTVAQQTATRVLTSAGLHVVSVDVSTDGSSIQATVASAGACDTSLDESALTGQIQHLLAFVHSLSIVVSGSGKTLDQYVAGSCTTTQSPPTGSGMVVLQQKGTGNATTASFTIHASSWTIAYVNNGRLLNVFPLKGSTPTPGAVVAKPHSSGSLVEHGAGTYKLRINATGSWSIVVREGT